MDKGTRAIVGGDTESMIRVIGVGIVVRGRGRGRGRRVEVLISRRRNGPGAVLGGFWEFPGGKLEPGETVEQAIRRELREEVGIGAEPTTPLTPIEHTYPHGRVLLRAMLCRWVGGEPTPIHADQCRWVALDDMDRYEFPPANAPLLLELRGLLSPTV